jgi:hypothetical protein
MTTIIKPGNKVIGTENSSANKELATAKTNC